MYCTPIFLLPHLPICTSGVMRAPTSLQGQSPHPRDHRVEEVRLEVLETSAASGLSRTGSSRTSKREDRARARETGAEQAQTHSMCNGGNVRPGGSEAKARVRSGIPTPVLHVKSNRESLAVFCRRSSFCSCFENDVLSRFQKARDAFVAREEDISRRRRHPSCQHQHPSSLENAGDHTVEESTTKGTVEVETRSSRTLARGDRKTSSHDAREVATTFRDDARCKNLPTISLEGPSNASHF